MRHAPTETTELQVEVSLSDLTLEEKCRLLSGASNWRTHSIDRLGIPALKMSDGPNGVRGEGQGADRTAGVALPVGICQGASWDPDLLGRLGDLLGREALRKGAHVLLAPSVNLHRTPIGGRTFEYFSEDPVLTARLAVALVRGVQQHHVAATVKHFVANDTERERMTVDVDVDERTLRELYLVPFEAAVVDGSAWAVMSSYNKVAGEHASSNVRLLRSVLRNEWRFDGVVVSDWFGAHDTIGCATGGMNIEMPGPARVYGEYLQRAVESGSVPPDVVDALVRDVLLLTERTRASQRPVGRAEESVDDPGERALCRESAIAGTVLLRNEAGVLPLDLSRLRRVAIVGPNAADTRTMGGGSSALRPLGQRSILEALAARFCEARVEVVHEPGVLIDRHTPLPRSQQLLGPDGSAGLEVTFVAGGLDSDDVDSRPVQATTRTDTTMMRWFGSLPDGADSARCVMRVRGQYIAAAAGIHEVGAVVAGGARVSINGEAIIDDPRAKLPRGPAFYGLGSIEVPAAVQLAEGEAVDIAVDLEIRDSYGGLRLGIRPPVRADLLERAVEAASDADAVVLVVGTNDEWETEGEDRDSIDLPGEQNELIARIAAVHSRVVVVLNAGSPIAMPWLDAVGAVVAPFFGGLEMGEAVAAVLVGDSDPGGRLPITFPRRLEDTPAWPHYKPVDGVQHYGEGLFMGYRGFDRQSHVKPLFAFGHGLSYGEVTWGDATADTVRISLADGSDDGVTVTVPLHNRGTREATVVVQGYVAPLDPPVARPLKELKDFAKVRIAAGSSAVAMLHFGRDAFRRWNVATSNWTIDPGCYELIVAASAADERARITVNVRTA